MRIRLAALFVLVLTFATQLHAESPAVPNYPPAKDVKADFLKLLDRPRVPLDAKVADAKPEAGGLVAEQIDFASQRRADGSMERVPVLLVRPEKIDSPRPCVIVLHGTGGDKEGQRAFLTDLAKRGIIGVAIDARYHGQRSGGAGGATAYVAAITHAWRTKGDQPQEHPFYYDTCWDLWRTVDYLVSRPDVDAQRLGMIGFSMGGIETWLAAAVDERIKVAVPAISVQSFRWSLEQDQWQGRARTIRGAHDAAAQDLGEKEVNQRVCRELWSKVIPGILDKFDCPSMLRLFAPDRELLILSGEKDPNCPIGGAEIAIESAQRSFREAKRADHLHVMVAPGVGHAVTTEQRQAALEWFEKWLKP